MTIGRQMDDAWKRAISEGRKKLGGAVAEVKYGVTHAKGVIANHGGVGGLAKDTATKMQKSSLNQKAIGVRDNVKKTANAIGSGIRRDVSNVKTLVASKGGIGNIARSATADLNKKVASTKNKVLGGSPTVQAARTQKADVNAFVAKSISAAAPGLNKKDSAQKKMNGVEAWNAANPTKKIKAPR